MSSSTRDPHPLSAHPGGAREASSVPRPENAHDTVAPSLPARNETSRVAHAARPLEEIAPFSSKLTKVLDDWGLDALIGLLLPGAGDLMTGTLSFAVLATALREGVPTIVLLRMLLNLGVDVLVGIFPLVGDLFDLYWRANRRNLALVERYRGGREKPTGADYAIVAVGYLLATVLIILPAIWLSSLGFGVATLFGAR